MELEGFGASLIGHVIYVNGGHETAWVPWEFITGTQYTCRILITGEGVGLRPIEAEGNWTIVARPTSPKDWSMIATLIRGMGGTILLAFDTHAPRAPDSFITFMDTVISEGRAIITRIWMGDHQEIPAIPDAIFFPAIPPLSEKSAAIHTMIQRLPARNNHGAFRTLSDHEWQALVGAATSSGVGIVISDVGESVWSLFWHKIADSHIDSQSHRLKRGLMWLRTGSLLIEQTTDNPV